MGLSACRSQPLALSAVAKVTVQSRLALTSGLRVRAILRFELELARPRSMTVRSSPFQRRSKTTVRPFPADHVQVNGPALAGSSYQVEKRATPPGSMLGADRDGERFDVLAVPAEYPAGRLTPVVMSISPCWLAAPVTSKLASAANTAVPRALRSVGKLWRRSTARVASVEFVMVALTASQCFPAPMCGVCGPGSADVPSAIVSPAKLTGPPPAGTVLVPLLDRAAALAVPEMLAGRDEDSTEEPEGRAQPPTARATMTSTARRRGNIALPPERCPKRWCGVR